MQIPGTPSAFAFQAAQANPNSGYFEPEFPGQIEPARSS